MPRRAEPPPPTRRGRAHVLLAAGLALALGVALAAIGSRRSTAPERLAPIAAESNASSAALSAESSRPTSAGPIDRGAGRELAAPPPAPAEPDRAAAAPPLALEGRVVLPPGTPPDEHLEVELDGRRALVAPDGAFRLPRPPGERHGVLHLRGRYLFLPEPPLVDLAHTPLVVTPHLGGRVEGVATSPRGSVAGRARLGPTTERRSVALETGCFAFDALPPGEHELHVVVADHVAWSRTVEVRAGETTEVAPRLVPHARVTGRVVGADGAPVEGARVALGEPPPPAGAVAPFVLIGRHDSPRALRRPAPAREGEREPLRAYTDAEGRFAFDAVAPDAWTLSARADGTSASRDLGHLRAGEERDAGVLALPPGATVTGVVRFPDGAPVASASVSAIRPTASGEADPAVRARDKTATDGTFTLRVPARAALVVTAYHRATPSESERALEALGLRPVSPFWFPRRGDASLRFETIWRGRATADAGARGVVVPLRPDLPVPGRVTDPSGAPVPSFTVELSPRGNLDRRVWVAGAARGDRGSATAEWSWAFANAEGRFVLPERPAGSWRLRVVPAAARLAAVSADVELPLAHEFALVCPFRAEVRGVVVDPGGAPVGGARVRAEGAVERVTATGADGRFVAEVTAGDVRLAAGSPGFAPSEWLAVEARAERPVDVVLHLRAPARITGRLHADATPLAGRTITAYARDVEVGERGTANAETDAEGRFTLAGLAPGTWSVTLWPPRSDDDVVTRRARSRAPREEPAGRFASGEATVEEPRERYRALWIQTIEAMEELRDAVLRAEVTVGVGATVELDGVLGAPRRD